ncbi:hypothetical protein Syn7502_03293 [Synechococcus sp. PCC 7502]|uniref:hypothetical protein n=1 Tax=Synechococcus sp. PCC 7502 TaxID=1173263 RepID=UPI00029FCFC2|nr:hypothetical protein [Synechococcus sp. PCC 7502]AFY75159.1 hypothetical protein Syn7502_03293 [Synechococcus sp. PCC 7502]
MERGLLWLPLLAIFIWLAWAGQQEYRKVEAYKSWAKDFERHKYDIYAVLGQRGDRLTWGTPTPKNPINLKTIRFSEIHKIQLKLDQTLYDEIPLNLTIKVKNISIELNADSNLNIPFTDLEIAYNWYKYLRDNLSVHLP